MLYVGSSIVVVMALLLYKRSERSLNFLSSLAKAIITYECYICMLGGLLTIAGLPVTVNSVSVVNILLCIYLITKSIKTKSYQIYYLDWMDLAFICVLGAIVYKVFSSRFSNELHIIFETSDPGTHLKMAMDMVTTNSVNNMYLGQLINGLFIESMEGIYSGAFVYKSFIIQYGINFFLAGFVFWSTITRYAQNTILKLISYGITVAYLLGYPYNDMLFGFVYLQMTISICCYLIAVTQDYLYNELNFKIYGILGGLGCLGVGIGYTLFAPIVWFAVLGCVMLKAHQEKWLLNKTKMFFSIKFILSSLYIYAIPAFITLWFLVIMPIFNNGNIAYGSDLNIEGYIYRNLYSDFWIFSLPAIYGYFYTIRTKNITLMTILAPLFMVYYFFFLYKMLNNEVSTYYFYKLNFLLWLIILFLFMIGLKYLFLNEKLLFRIIIGTILFSSTIYATRFEMDFNAKNANYIPFSDTESLFRIYTHNYIYYERKSQIPPELIAISDTINHIKDAENTVFIGYWLEQYWYEALTNIRLPIEWKWLSPQEMVEEFLSGNCGAYAVITKDSEAVNIYQDYIDTNQIFECDYAYIIKRDN